MNTPTSKMVWHAQLPGSEDLPYELRTLFMETVGDGTDNKESVQETFRMMLTNAHQIASHAAAMAWHMLARWAATEPPDAMLHAAIRYALNAHAQGKWGEKDSFAGEAVEDDATRDRLARELRQVARQLQVALELDPSVNGPPNGDDARRPDDPATERPMLWWDARSAGFLETLGENGQSAAETTRREARDRWEAVHQQLELDGEIAWGPLWGLWWNPGGDNGLCPILLRLTSVVWLDRWRPEMEREQRNRERFLPAIGASQLDLLARLAFDPGRTVEMSPDGRSASIKDRTGMEVGRLAGVDATVLASIESEIRESQRVSADFLRVFGGLVTEGHRQKADDPEGAQTDRVIVHGGWGGLCDLVGAKNQNRVRKAFQFGRALEIPLPEGGEILGLWKGEIIRERRFGKRYARLIIDLSRWLLPPRRGEQLVPILPPDREPALPADRSLTAPALLLVQYLLQHLRTHAELLLDNEPVPITDDDWTMMALRADVSRLDAVRGPLVIGADDRPPLLRMVTPGGFDLAEDYADVRRFLVAGGQATRRSREKGKAAQRKKEADRKKAKRKRP
jgi:hypothetical protein